MSTKCIYICAAGHSGSTLLDLLLGSHSKVASLGEITQLPKNISLNTICMCGQPIKQCSFWQKVLFMMSRRLGVDLRLEPYALNLGFINAKVIVDKKHQNFAYNLRRKISRALDYAIFALGPEWLCKLRTENDLSVLNNFLLYEEVIHLQNVNCVVDSSKDYIKAVKLYRFEPEKIKVIFLVRDGRGVFYSLLKRGFPPKRSLMAWLNHNRRAFKIIKRHILKNDHLFVKYENLVENTTHELKRICNFLNIKYEKKMIEFLAKPHHIANGNNMRFSKSSNIRLDTEWKKNLKPSEIEYFNKIAGLTNQSFGYSQCKLQKGKIAQ